MKNFFKDKLLKVPICIIILLVINTKVAFASDIPLAYINEIYPNPNSDEKEFVEIVLKESETEISTLKINDLTTTSKPISIINEESNLAVAYISGSYLNNGGECVKLIQTDSGEIIDCICYGKVDIPEEIINKCKILNIVPEKGYSISRFEDENGNSIFYELTSPTSEKENILTKLDFDLEDSSKISKTSFPTEGTISIKNKSQIYGREDIVETWYLDDKIIDCEIPISTSTLQIGKHTVRLELSEHEYLEKEFLIVSDHTGLIISEVLPNPEGTDETGINEWLEIYNSSNKNIDLLGLKIKRIADSGTEYIHIVEKTEILKNGEYTVIYPDFALTNSGINLKLFTCDDKEIDEFSFNFSVGDDESVIRVSDEILISDEPTPGSENHVKPILINVANSKTDETKFPKFDGLIISEIFANPEGKDIKGENEWVEIYNASGSEMNLFGLKLIERTSTAYSYIFNEEKKLRAGEYLVLFPTFAINNSGATFILCNSSEEMFDEANYDNSIKENYSLIRNVGSSQFTLSSSPTPGTENIGGTVLSAETIIVQPISESKTNEKSTSVIIIGNVTTPPGKFSDDNFYIQDESTGIQVRVKDPPTLQLGQEVEVRGTIDSYHSEPVIKAESIETKDEIVIVQPRNIKAVDFDINLVGELIIIDGLVEKTSGNTFYVNDGTGTIKINIKDETEIERPPCRKGYYARIIGILSVWDKDDEGNLNFRVLPRFQEDVFISKELAGTGEPIVPEVLLGLILIFAMGTCTTLRIIDRLY